MKTKFRNILPLLMGALALAGCNGNDGEPGGSGRHGAPRFTAAIGAASRASDTSWDAGDLIGISGGDYTNICHVTETGDGSFNVREGEPINFTDEEETEFYAYYPWTELAAGTTTIAVDTKDQANRKNFDFLWGEGTGKPDNPEVFMNLTHRMAKVVFTVKPGDGMTFEDMVNMEKVRFSLTGCRHDGSFDIINGTTSIQNQTEPWDFSGFGVMDEERKTLTYPLILFPQEFATQSLEFIASLTLPDIVSYTLVAALDFTSANSKDGEDAKNEWVGGRQYNLNITLNRADLRVDGCTIEAWNTIDDPDEVAAI